jgi:porin
MNFARNLSLLATAALLSTNSLAEDDIWTRQALFDTPDGPKRQLKEKGVDIGVQVTQFVQTLQDSGDGWPTGGKFDFRFTLNGQKLGTWPGFFVTSHIEYNYGNSAVGDAVGLNIIPVNTAQAYPSLNSSMFSLLFTQAFSPTTTLTAGLFNMFDAAARRPLVGGGGIDTFWNLAMAASLTNITPPYIFGVSFNTRYEDIGSFGIFIYDPRDAQNLNIISNLFSEGATYSATATFPVTIAGLGGFQNFRVAYSTLDGLDLSSLPPGLPVVQPQPPYQTDRWYLQYSFEQSLVQDAKDPKVGWGPFGQVGYSDGNPNAFHWHWFLGLAGNNMMAGRQLDRFGIGYYQYTLSDHLVNSLPIIGPRLGPQKGVEAFYNWAITPWFRLTADWQWQRQYNDLDNNYYLGLRAQVKFF